MRALLRIALVVSVQLPLVMASPASANAPRFEKSLGLSVCERTTSSPGAAGAMWWLRYMCWAMN